ncbi:restriction endonuclease [Pseudactinotalea sp. HY160]|uniref:restriction endonuclease n=1 Tax=Pseudactinotalea sp. HY160 TaxID=2654490 RepID=UPI00128CAB4A|nr:restriction endonuclease [Pseudactinotalea sp. HY160]MPV49386.1 restriction endonuclease [Pseudactinotalea sp. HY160]
MSAPTWEEYMVPTLRVLADGETRRGREIVEAAADLLELTAEQRTAIIPSGQERYRNRGTWALSYLARAGAIERPVRAHYRMTEVGRRLLADHPGGITKGDLHALAGGPNAPDTGEVFGLDAGVQEQGRSVSTHFQETTPHGPTDALDAEESALDPEEQISFGVARINEDVADQLLTRIRAQEPVFFEQAVLDLLMAMGYGGAEGEATRTQLSNDGGIDGIIDQDALGLSRIYVQAKRYGAENTVGREAIQAFVGALAGNQANQGVFITTSRFSRTAIDYAGSVATRVILIDGDRLARLMIRYGVGVQVKRRIEIVEIDEDFFE